ncbi:MAG: isoprenylcysteine carboxylmethyltransferase family protein [Chloroflexota bacterium]
MPDAFAAGWDVLRTHVPPLRSPGGIAGLLSYAAAVFGLTSGFFVIVDREFPEWMPDGEIVVLALGFLILARFFSQKARYQARFGDQAYARAVSAFVIPGLGIVFASIAHLAYMPGPQIPDLWWRPILTGTGWLSLVLGAALWWRAVSALGPDTLAMLYVYHPEERRIVDTGIYSLLRHPVYAAALRVSAGLALIRANWYALLVALIVPLFFHGWIRLVEEAELIRQFPAYVEYRRRVPAFAPRLLDLGKFWKFLLLGG